MDSTMIKRLVVVLFVLTGCAHYSPGVGRSVRLVDGEGGVTDMHYFSDSLCMAFVNKDDTASIWKVRFDKDERHEMARLAGWRFDRPYSYRLLQFGSTLAGTVRSSDNLHQSVFLYNCDADSLVIIPPSFESVSMRWVEGDGVHFICWNGERKEICVDSTGRSREFSCPDYGKVKDITWTTSLGRCWIQHNKDSLFVGAPGHARRFYLPSPRYLSPLASGDLLVVSELEDNRLTLFIHDGQEITRVLSWSKGKGLAGAPIVSGKSVFIPIVQSMSAFGVMRDGLYSLDGGMHWKLLKLGTMENILSLTDSHLYYVNGITTEVRGRELR